MDKYGAGLNLLIQNTTPPSSGRSRISLNKTRSQRSIIHYNGNYEGDSSMFKNKLFELDHLSLMSSESDTEYSNDIAIISKLSVKANNESTSLVWRLIQFLMEQFLKPDMREKLSHKLANFMESTLFMRFAKCWSFIAVFLTYIFYLTFLFCKRLALLGNILWKSRVIFRNLSRRLLWWLTLAKCNDLMFFALILFSTPVLLILALFGFIITICSSFKEALHYYGVNFMNKI